VSIEPAGQTRWSPERLAALSKALVAVVVAGILFGIIAVYANLYYIAAVVGGIAVTLLIAWKFEAVLLIYVLIAFIPWGRTPDLAIGGSGQGKGIFVSEILLAYILSIWLVRYLLRLVPKVRSHSGFDKPIILYTIYSVICLVNGFIFWDSHVDRIYQHPSVNIIELGFRLLSAGAFVMMATSVSDAKWLKRTAVVALVPGLFNLANAATGGRIPINAPWWPLLAFLPASYLCAVALDTRARRLHRVISAAVVCAALFVILVKNITWASGWLGLCVSLFAIILIKNKKLFVACLIIVGIAVVAFQPFFKEKVIVESARGGDYSRFALMRGAWKYATTFPLGVGPGNYRSYNSFYYGEKWGTTAFTSAHGTYSQHLAEMGIPGLLLFLAMPVCGAWWLLKNYKRMRNGFPRTFVLATVGQLAGICAAAVVGDYIIPAYHNGGLTTFSSTVYSWLIWGLAVAAVRISDRQADGSINSSSQLEHPGSAGPVPAIGITHD
jgi:O-antigen ligase